MQQSLFGYEGLTPCAFHDEYDSELICNETPVQNNVSLFLTLKVAFDIFLSAGCWCVPSKGLWVLCPT